MAPKTVTLDGPELATIKARLRAGNDATLKAALAVLTAEADSWLGQGPWSVVTKSRPFPSGDKHDYVSQAPYFWPDPAKPETGGRPYIQRDGEKNPEVLEYTDRVYVEKVFRASYTLALAWYYTDNAAYAQHAAAILRTWFVVPDTAMNPHLNHAQLIPGVNTGRGIGIIDFAQAYASTLDAAAILADAPTTTATTWTADDDAGFRRWNTSFLHWLVHSDFGRTEHAEPNNHGSFAAMLIATIAAYVGDTAQARAEAQFVRRLLATTLGPDGSQPAELRRTRSWHYSTFNLQALTRLAMVADRVEGTAVDSGGRVWDLLYKPIEYILPAAVEGPSRWQYPDLKFQRFAAADIVRAAARAGHAASQAAVDRLELPPDGDLWPLRPAPEQLDPVKADV
ncbi:Alginate lyase domain protein [Niveomyces insectorum RCEF 264]|uniref:Alginate lyase domain protein n=1 Tax=Niveomyces insectorum RCEF 264 TaxID=1081102 RepID=A0A167Y605_9HYPO|nr:Alginate lyase domain protein [Niveomyces insectorum RCEF 264]